MLDTDVKEATVSEEQLSSFRPTNPDPNITRGRKAGDDHLEVLDIEHFILTHDCLNLLIENAWIKKLRLVSNPYMYRSLGRANYKTNTVELSKKVMEMPVSVQREVFIRAVCHFIANKIFSETGDGQGYFLLVKRFMRFNKGQSNSTGNISTTAVKEPVT